MRSVRSQMSEQRPVDRFLAERRRKMDKLSPEERAALDELVCDTVDTLIDELGEPSVVDRLAAHGDPEGPAAKRVQGRYDALDALRKIKDEKKAE